MPDAVSATREAIDKLSAAVDRLRSEYGDTLGVRRITSDLARFSADLDELGGPAPGHRPAVAPERQVIPDEPYDETMWGADDDSETSHAF